MGWLWWLRASWTYTILLLGELDNAVQDIQQTFPAGEMVSVCEGVICACPGATGPAVLPPTLAWAMIHPGHCTRCWQW